ncbi:hypothetical protein IP91_05120 [Pseudoduganella lurida]|uniref:Uncharacterized protein n=1 Tax=Pseudoduganella lurida TaxID=1036180 RepID=A0A562QUH6_9BURK|nr:hypothetical protein [Pseudoduganella lurida]TWI60425.1 hypothetical protein IP91_05120 [Pseudoduganella lurida]
MQLPAALVGRVFAFSAGPPGWHFLPAGAPRDGLLLRASTRDELVGKYPGLSRKLGVAAFFDMLGGTKRHRPAYQAEGIERAVRYTKASHGRLHAYWIEAAPGDTQTLHIALDGSDTVYTLAGGITPQWYDAFLAHLRIAPIP